MGLVKTVHAHSVNPSSGFGAALSINVSHWVVVQKSVHGRYYGSQHLLSIAIVGNDKIVYESRQWIFVSKSQIVRIRMSSTLEFYQFSDSTLGALADEFKAGVNSSFDLS